MYIKKAYMIMYRLLRTFIEVLYFTVIMLNNSMKMRVNYFTKKSLFFNIIPQYTIAFVSS